HPFGGRVLAEGHVLVPRVGEAQEVPGRVDEGVHGVGLAYSGSAVDRARRVEEAFVESQRRLTGGPELDVVGGEDRELVLGDGHDTMVGAVNDGDRAAPEPL